MYMRQRNPPFEDRVHRADILALGLSQVVVSLRGQREKRIGGSF
jgi:hypothetical protein